MRATHLARPTTLTRPHALFRPYPPRDERGEGKQVAFAVVGGLVLLGWLFGGTDLSDDAPEGQVKFVETVQKAQKAAEDTDNEMRIVADRKARNADLCATLPTNLAVSGWTGKVTELDTTLGGDSGVITIEMAEDIEVSTWNNGLSDLSANTLIDETSDLYADMTSLSEGDDVVFSGRFIKDSDSCLVESSLSDRGGMETPTFIMKFKELAAKD